MGLLRYPIQVISDLIITGALLIAAIRRYGKLRGPAKAVVRHVTFRQVLFTGVDAIPLVALLGATVGIIVVLQSAARLPSVGQAEFMGKLLVLFVLKELGPILVSLVVVARSGTAIAAELGIMAVRGEIDGLEGVGVDPLVYLVWPRVVGVATAVLSLAIVFNMIAFVAGFGFAAFSSPTMSFVSLFQTLFRAMTLQDMFISGLKSGAMGVAIAGICAHHGLQASEASTQVPVQTLRAVMTAFWACLSIELVLTILFTDLSVLTL